MNVVLLVCVCSKKEIEKGTPGTEKESSKRRQRGMGYSVKYLLVDNSIKPIKQWVIYLTNQTNSHFFIYPQKEVFICFIHITQKIICLFI